MFYKNRLSAAIVTVMASAGAHHAIAQDQPTAVEEVIVTGIRASVQASMDIKRDSTGVVDAISAEDIGKFPDTNLAESLQRITGVSIERDNGEGSRITVRGFGPENNMVTLNGRVMPGGSAYGGGNGAPLTRGGNSRAFDFANLASEAVSGVEVYKTSKANIATGGIGATVNILTTRPLDNPGLQGSVGVKAVNDTTNRIGDDITPEVSGLVSWTDDDEKVGVSLSASVQERDSGYTGATVNAWNIGVWGDEAYDLYNQGIAPTEDDPDTAVDESDPGRPYWESPVFGDEASHPEFGQLYARPNDIRYAFSDTSRRRTNAQLTVQFAPSDQLTATVDYTFAKNEIEEFRGEITNWVQNGSVVQRVDFDDSAIATPTLIHEDYRDGSGDGFRDIGFEQQYRSQENTLDSIGLNLEYAVNDELTVEFDAHHSTMESMPTGPGHSGSLDVGLGAPIKQGKTLYFGGELPYWTWSNPEGTIDYINDCNHAELNPTADFPSSCDGVFDANDVSSSVMRVWSAEQTSEVTQIQLNGMWEFDNGRFDFGIDRRETSSETINYNGNNNQVLGGWGADNPGEFPDGMIDPFNIVAEFEDFNTGMSPTTAFRADSRELAYFLADRDGGATWYADLLPFVGIDNRELIDEDTGEVTVRNSKGIVEIEEDTTGLYAQVGFESELAEFPVNILAGLRYETTDLTSTSGTPPVIYLNWASDNDFGSVSASGGTPTVAENSYDNLLPSLDFDISFTDDVKGRFSYSKTIARPGLGNLSPDVSNYGLGGSTLLGYEASANGSNPQLLPLESSNVDVSVEWYFDDTSYVSVGAFEKRVVNFVGTSQVSRSDLGIQDQTAGPRALAARNALLSLGQPVDNATLHTMMVILDNPDVFPNGAADYTGTAAQISQLGEGDSGAYDLTPNADDPAMEFIVSQPVNNREAKLYGMEFAVQHFFGDSGFGVLANYTFVSGDVSFDNLADPSEDQFALLGLSDTANLVLMYENYGIQARLAYNWRDKYLDSTNNNGSSRNPFYTEEHSQIDLNVAYELTDDISIFFEGINLTGEDRRQYARNEKMLVALEDLGARYQFGARYSF